MTDPDEQLVDALMLSVHALTERTERYDLEGAPDDVKSAELRRQADLAAAQYRARTTLLAHLRALRNETVLEPGGRATVTFAGRDGSIVVDYRSEPVGPPSIFVELKMPADVQGTILRSLPDPKPSILHNGRVQGSPEDRAHWQTCSRCHHHGPLVGRMADGVTWACMGSCGGVTVNPETCGPGKRP